MKNVFRKLFFRKSKAYMKQIVPEKYFDISSFNDEERKLEIECYRFNTFTIPFLQDIGFLASSDDLDKIRFALSQNMNKCYEILENSYLDKNGRGKNNLQKFYEYVLQYKLGCKNSNPKHDTTGILYQKELDPVPNTINSDICKLVIDTNGDFRVKYDLEDLKNRHIHVLQGDSAKGYENIINLCTALNDLGKDYTSFDNYVYYDEKTCSWQIRRDIPFSLLTKIGK